MRIYHRGHRDRSAEVTEKEGDKDNAEAQRYAEVRRETEKRRKEKKRKEKEKKRKRKEGPFGCGLLKAEGSAQDDSAGVTRLVEVSGGTR